VAIDANAERRRAITQAFPGASGAESLSAAADDVDAVIIATPPITHLDMAMEAIEAGKHVLVEKPLALTSADGQALVDAAATQGVMLMVGHTFEYNAAVVRLHEIVQGGDLGAIHYIDSARLNLGLYQHDVNVLWDLAPHDISICNYVLQATPTEVTAWGTAHAGSGFEDVASIRLDYESIGVTATIRVSWLDPNKVRQTTVVGSQMMAVYNDLKDNERLKLYDRGVSRTPSAAESEDHSVPMTYRYGDIVAPHVEFPEPLLVEDRDFVLSATNGTEPKASGRNGLAVVTILEAANRSLVERQSVSIEPLQAVEVS
jgi:predicted dehydrogenase